MALPAARPGVRAPRIVVPTTAGRGPGAKAGDPAKALPVRQSKAPDCVCAVGGIIDLVGKKWTMCIIVAVGNRPGIRFGELQSGLWGISPRTLSETLKGLEREGIVERKAFAEIPPRVEYRLTGEGVKLRDAVKPLMEYAAARPGAVCPPAVVC